MTGRRGGWSQRRILLFKGVQMDDNSRWQKFAADFSGTAFLVFVGVGSVPATLMINGDAPFTMADLGMISLAFGTIVMVTVYVFAYISGNHIGPAVTCGLAAKSSGNSGRSMSLPSWSPAFSQHSPSGSSHTPRPTRPWPRLRRIQ